MSNNTTELELKVAFSLFHIDEDRRKNLALKHLEFVYVSDLLYLKMF